MDSSLSPNQLQQQSNELEAKRTDEEQAIGTPRPIEDDDSHTTKKQKLDHLAIAPSSPPLQPPLASPSSMEQPLATRAESPIATTEKNRGTEVAVFDQHVESIDNTTIVPEMPPPIQAAAPLPPSPPSQPQPPSSQSQPSPSMNATASTTVESRMDISSPVAKPIQDSPVDPIAHSPETLEIISNEGSSPPPFAFANATGISPIQSKPRKQKPSRTASPSPYSFGAANTNMTRDQIKFCGAIMRNLKKHRDATPFIHPVDYVKLKIPDYPQIIKHPMDLTTIDRKLQHGDYNDVDQFIADIRLLFNNCYKFNGPEAMVSMLCQNVESAFEKSLRQMPPSKESSSTHDSPDAKDGLQQHSSPHGGSATTTTTSFRRISEDSRPKREIHPPPSKDYPETVTKQRRGTGSSGSEQSAAVIKRRKADVQLKFCGQAIRELKKNKYRDLNYPFLHPVDAVALNIPDYHTIITHPMDISTIERNLNNGEYDSPESFESDVRLMFNNCYRYNPPALPVHKMAKELEKVFDEKWQHLPEREPTPPPPSPPARRPSPPTLPTNVITRKADSYTSSDDEDGDGSEESDNDRDDRIAELERHIANISQQIASIKSTKKKSDKSSSKSASSSGTKRKASGSGQRSTTNNKKSSASSSTTKDKPAPKPRRRPSAKQAQPRKLSIHELPEFTFEQKKDLSENINNLSGDRLNTVVSIIQSSMSLDGVKLMDTDYFVK
ncbi:unnamed protein product [Absidia cylindrospora]